MPDRAFKTISSLDHNPKLAQALGNMIVAWSQAENVVQDIFRASTQLNFDKANAAYLAPSSFEQKVKLTQNLLKCDNTIYGVNEIVNELEKLKKLAQTRNDYVHGKWSASIDERRNYVFRMRKAKHNRRQPVTTSNVENHTRSVLNRAEHLLSLLRASPLPKS